MAAVWVALGTDPALREGDPLLRLVEPTAPQARDPADGLCESDERVVAPSVRLGERDRLLATALGLRQRPRACDERQVRERAQLEQWPSDATGKRHSRLEVALGVSRVARPERCRPETDQDKCPQVLAKASLYVYRPFARRQQPRCLRGHCLGVIAGPCQQQAQRPERDLQPRATLLGDGGELARCDGEDRAASSSEPLVSSSATATAASSASRATASGGKARSSSWRSARSPSRYRPSQWSERRRAARSPPCRLRVADRLDGEAVRGEPVRRNGVQGRQSIGRRAAQFERQQIAEELVVAEGRALRVDRRHECAALLELVKDARAAAASGQPVGQLPGDLIQDRSAQQQSSHFRRLALESSASRYSATVRSLPEKSAANRSGSGWPASESAASLRLAAQPSVLATSCSSAPLETSTRAVWKS